MDCHFYCTIELAQNHLTSIIYGASTKASANVAKVHVLAVLICDEFRSMWNDSRIKTCRQIPESGLIQVSFFWGLFVKSISPAILP